jgi:hypothetical protein
MDLQNGRYSKKQLIDLYRRLGLHEALERIPNESQQDFIMKFAQQG